MKPLRAAMILTGAGFAMASTLVLAQGQAPDAAVLNIMRECAKIDDPTSRLACYDNNIRGAGGRPVVPGQTGRVAGGGAPLAGSRGGYGPQGFGSESIKTQERFASAEARGLGPDAITAQILGVRQRERGVYLITLEGGAQWLFSESVDSSFRPPRKGDSVDISRAALGSFLMRFDNQESVRVRRVK